MGQQRRRADVGRRGGCEPRDDPWVGCGDSAVRIALELERRGDRQGRRGRVDHRHGRGADRRVVAVVVGREGDRRGRARHALPVMLLYLPVSFLMCLLFGSPRDDSQSKISLPPWPRRCIRLPWPRAAFPLP